MIRNIIFDIGNVLLNFEPKEYVKSKIGGEKVEEIYESIFKSEEWSMLDRGTINEEEAKTNIINRKIENKEFVNLIFQDWYDILAPIESSVEMLRKLKEKGYKIFYLSNFHLAAFQYVTKKHDFFQLFDGGVVSYKEKLLKPEKVIYEKILDRYELEPSESIFIDDTKENVIAAMEHGINGIILENPKNLGSELEKFKIIV